MYLEKKKRRRPKQSLVFLFFSVELEKRSIERQGKENKNGQTRIDKAGDEEKIVAECGGEGGHERPCESASLARGRCLVLHPPGAGGLDSVVEPGTACRTQERCSAKIF